ncbi:MAG: alpha/beta fold hydrolase [Rubrivivax sp.]
MLTPAFAGELFGLGQPLDAARHFIILPDAIGHGRSSKPSDGLRTAFPKYSYDDMVVAQHRLLTEHLGVKRLRVVMGNSMGAAWRRGSSRRCTWVSPTSRKLMASLPVEMSGRNWTSEELIVDSIRNDLEWMPSGNYTKQLVSARVASVFALATNGGNQALRQGRACWQAKADALLDVLRLAAPFTADANDTLYQWDHQRLQPRRGWRRSRACCWPSTPPTTNATSPELGVLEREIRRIKGAASSSFRPRRPPWATAPRRRRSSGRRNSAKLLASAPRLHGGALRAQQEGRRA